MRVMRLSGSNKYKGIDLSILKKLFAKLFEVLSISFSMRGIF